MSTQMARTSATCILTSFVCTGFLGTLSARAGAETVVIQKNVRQLFFDEYIVDDSEGLARTVNQPVKHSMNPVLRREHPWEGLRVQVYGTVIHDPAADQFKMWYMNIPNRPENKITVDGELRPGHATLVSYATSKDGIAWHKPILNLVDFEGSKRNNMVCTGMYNAEGFSVWYDPNDSNPERRYKAFYWDHGMDTPFVKAEGGYETYGSSEKEGMYVAFSRDGIHWEPYEGNPVMNYNSDSGQVVLYDDQIKRYVAFGRLGVFGRKVGRSESKDFIHWEKPELVIKPDEQDGPNTEIYGITVDYYADMYIGILWMLYIDRQLSSAHNHVGRIDFQLCHSRDGKSWVRDPERSVFIPNGPESAWDAGDMRGACRSVILPDRILIYYAGAEALHGTASNMDIGLATLRRDGWVSLDATDKPGVLVTKPFMHPSGELYINADASHGSITGEFLSAEGEVLTELGTSRAITSDTLKSRVQFSRASIAPTAGKLVRLRLRIHRAKLFSFWFRD